MIKYKELISIFGYRADFNDKIKNGRSLKWTTMFIYNAAERKDLAEKCSKVSYVTKVFNQNGYIRVHTKKI